MQSPRRVAIFGSFLANPQSGEYQMADELGYLLARSSCTIICGGHGGIPAALLSGATRGDGKVLGVSLAESAFPQRGAKIDPRMTETVIVRTVAERLAYFARSDGYVFFSGGIGSLAEFAFIWHSLQLETDFGRPVILVSRAWHHVVAAIRHEQMVKYKYYQNIYLCEHVKEAVAILTNDYSLQYDDPGGIYRKDSVLFDLDGAIVESPEEEFIKACENFGYFFPVPHVRAAFGKAGRAPGTSVGTKRGRDDFSPVLSILEHLGMDTGAATRIADHVRREFRQIPEIYPDAADILHHFKESGFSTGIVSTRPPREVQEILSAHRLSGLIDMVVSRVGTGRELDGIRKEGMIHIGVDFPGEGHEPGAAGIDSILLDRHLTHILDDRAFKIRSLGELRHLIKHR
jgi:predicted Rossmann-fold nucleotide-binding protein/phosphoserine phosphatase